MGTPTVLGLGVGGAFGTMIVSSVIAVALCEFLGRAFESAEENKENKEWSKHNIHRYIFFEAITIQFY